MNLILKNFLTDEVSPYMKEIGYRKSGGYFYRQNEHFVYTICIEEPSCAIFQDEFIISASIFSHDIAGVLDYYNNDKSPKDLHGFHYSLYNKDIIILGEGNSISIGDYDIHVLGDHVRKSLLNLNEFFKSIKDIDDFLSLLLENGCGRQPFFSNYVVIYALLTKRWKYAEELINKEAERRPGWEFPTILAEKFKDLCEGDTGHRAFGVSWEKSLLRNRAAPQGVKILTKEWDDFILEHTRTDQLYQKHQNWIFSSIPDDIKGVMDYKDDSWDFMTAYYIRSGMVAAVSMKVKAILEGMNVSKEEYVLVPIAIQDSNTQHYLLFIKSIGHDEIDFSNSLYRKILGDDEYRKFASYSEFSASPESYTIAFPVLPQKYAKRDLIYIQNGAETYISARLIKAFREAGIKGISFHSIGTLRFSDNNLNVGRIHEK